MPATLIRHAVDNNFELIAPGIFVRDLGIGGATDGRDTLQVVHLEPEGARVEALHRHDEGFSLAYVLKGWRAVRKPLWSKFSHLRRRRVGARSAEQRLSIPAASI